MAKKKSQSGFLKLYQPIRADVFRYICAHHPNFSEAEDLLQDCSLVAWEKFEDFRGSPQQFKTWVIGIAKYKILHSKRRFLRDMNFLNEEQSRIAEENFLNSSEDKDKKDDLATCIAQLSKKLQTLLFSRYYERKSCLDLAKMSKRSHSQIRTQLHRVRNTLKTCLKNQKNL